ncbi:hypothetical protein D3C81_1194000 [compost metagenome]
MLGRQHARGARDRAEVALDAGQRGGGIELARHHQHRIVGLVVAPVERAQVVDADVLDVAARADRGLAVVVPAVGGGHGLLHQHARRAVLAHFHLVAHHGHLAVEVVLGQHAVDHAVRFHAQRPVEVFVAGGKGAEVVGTVLRGGAVDAHAAPREFGRDGLARQRRRALEQQVLEQVRHAGLAVVLVAAAHEVGDVDRGGGLGRVGRQHDAQAVGQAVFGDALHGGSLPRQRRRCRRHRLHGLRRRGQRGQRGKHRQVQGKTAHGVSGVGWLAGEALKGAEGQWRKTQF